MSEFKRKKIGKSRPKINLVFDENKRRDFLTGFHKRKLQRKKEAKEKFEQDLKNERKRIKNEAKESYKKLIVSHRPIPELENLIKEEYEEDDVTVKVIEFSTNDNTRLGVNKPHVVEEEEETGKSDDDQCDDIPGMELKPKVRSKPKEKNVPLKSNKDIKKIVKNEATKTVKKSKVFQMKNKLERQKQKKKSLHMKNQRIKFSNKRNRSKGSFSKRKE